MSVTQEIKVRFAKILELPPDQVDSSFLLRKLAKDAETSCIVINTNTQKIFSLKNTSSYTRIK